jgi:multiple sugar transport system substrate-binding protein
MQTNFHAATSPQGPFTGCASRRELLQVAAALGLAGAFSGSLGARRARASTDDALTVTIDGWIPASHTPIADVDADFTATFPLAPTPPAFDYNVMMADLAKATSTWDAYVGATPFFELIQFADSGAIEPWDTYLPAGVLDDLPPAVRAEGTYDGKFYMWPVLLDVVVQSWNGAILERAGLDPDALPTDWDAFIANAATIQSSGAATYGCGYDVTPWRSLIPIAHSLGTDLYHEDGTFAWASDTAVQALEIMRRMTELSYPGAGSPDTFMNHGPHFALEDMGVLVTYGTSALLDIPTWADPVQLRMASLPTTAANGGGSVFWDTGAVLFTHGQHKAEAAAYLHALTSDQRVWQHSLAGDPGVKGSAVGQMPASTSIWAEYAANPPAWLADAPWATAMWDAMDHATSVQPTKIGFDQFVIALPFYTAYLTGDETDAKTALQKAEDAIAAEMAK